MKIKVLIFCSIIIILLAGFFYYNIYSPLAFAEDKGSRIIDIPQSVSAGEIIRTLKSNNIIKSEFFARVFLKIKGWDLSLLAGEYEFFSHESTKEVLRKIHLGKIKGIRITIPEGSTNVEIAEILGSLKFINKEKFITLSQKEEGFLFPDTYYFYKGISEQEIIDLMKEQFNKVVSRLAGQKDDDVKLDLRGCVILASIVEKESNFDNDRKMVASVFLNRLRKRIRLESCVTVMYAIGKHKDNLTSNDLKIDSPYNTYIHYGLPPGPICNPGESALSSVFNPAKSEFLFFVSRLDGTHEFSRTLQEHISAKNKYK